MRKAHYSTAEIPTTGYIWAGERPLDASASYIKGTLRHVRKNFIFLTLWVTAFGVSAFFYAKFIYPDFVATTQILLRPRFIVTDGPENLRHVYQSVIDGDQCETELLVLSSQDMLFQVFTNLKLADASEPQQGADGLWAFLNSRLDRLQLQGTSNRGAIEAFNAFRGRVRARRLGLSYVIEVAYRGRSAEQATRIVNAIASTYAAYRLRGVLAHEQRRGAYLASRLTSLFNQIRTAEAGARSGSIPEDGLPDADVRLLGPAVRPIGIAYPKTAPLVLMMAGLGLASGLLLILLPRGAPVRHKGRAAASAAI